MRHRFPIGNQVTKGRVPWNKGGTSWSKGKHLSEEHRMKIGLAQRGRKGIVGQNHYRWIADRMLLKDDHKDRGGQLHKDWSKRVKNRDNWKCRISNENCKGRIEAHHILGWTDYPEIRYNINNGITLCHAHHPRKRAEEKLLIPEFQRLVEVSNCINFV